MEERENEELVVAEESAASKSEESKSSAKMKQFLQVLKFTAFSASAGVIQFVVTSLLFDWTGWLPYWAAYVIGLTLSVVWNFTFNRKFTFAAATNITLSSVLVILYNCIIVVPIAYGGDCLSAYWGYPYGMLVTVIGMLINFVTEFFWDKFVVFNDVVIGRLEKLFKRNKAEGDSELASEEAAVGKVEQLPEEATSDFIADACLEEDLKN